jgi:hypothetical protein
MAKSWYGDWGLGEILMTPIFARPRVTQPAFVGTLKPNGDVNKTNYKNKLDCTTNIYQSIDDDSASTYITTDEILMATCDGTPEVRTCRFDMTNPSPAPNGAESVSVRVRARYNSAEADPSIDMVIKLYESTTLIATGGTEALTGSHVWYILFLSQAQKDAVSNWNNVRIDASMTICEGTDAGSGGGSIKGEIEEEEITFT